MRTFKIKVARHRGKHIQVTKYLKTAAGASIVITHNVPTSAGKAVQWVQTVSDNSVFTRECKVSPHVDPFADPSGAGDPAMHTVSLPSIGGSCRADDLKPFYYTDSEIAGGAGAPTFSDSPGINAPASGRTWTKFVTALTEVTGKDVLHLVAIAWGYDRLSDGTVLMAAVRTPTTIEMRDHGRALKRMYPDLKYR